jgi:hypothetical protein
MKNNKNKNKNCSALSCAKEERRRSSNIFKEHNCNKVPSNTS